MGPVIIAAGKAAQRRASSPLIEVWRAVGFVIATQYRRPDAYWAVCDSLEHQRLVNLIHPMHGLAIGSFATLALLHSNTEHRVLTFTR